MDFFFAPKTHKQTSSLKKTLLEAAHAALHDSERVAAMSQECSEVLMQNDRAFSLFDLGVARDLHFNAYGDGCSPQLSTLQQILERKSVQNIQDLFFSSILCREKNTAYHVEESKRLLKLKVSLLLKDTGPVFPAELQSRLTVMDAIGEGGINLTWGGKMRGKSGLLENVVLRLTKTTRVQPLPQNGPMECGFLYEPFDWVTYRHVFLDFEGDGGATSLVEMSGLGNGPIQFKNLAPLTVLKEALVLCRLRDAPEFFVHVKGYYELLDRSSFEDGVARRRSVLVLADLRDTGASALSTYILAKGQNLSRKEALHLCWSMLGCVIALHDRHVANVDSTLENYWVTNNSVQKTRMFDFDAAQSFSDLKPLVTRPRSQYLSPIMRIGNEEQRALENGQRADLWFAGVNVYYLLQPRNDNLQQLLQQKMNDAAEDARVNLDLTRVDLKSFKFRHKPPSSLRNLMMKLLRVDPRNRPEAWRWKGEQFMERGRKLHGLASGIPNQMSQRLQTKWGETDTLKWTV